MDTEDIKEIGLKQEELYKEINPELAAEGAKHNILLHYLFKNTFRGMVKGCYRCLPTSWKKQPQTMYQEPAVIAFWTAMTKIADKTAAENNGSRDGDVELYEYCRDIICALAESQKAYREKFRDFTEYFMQEYYDLPRKTAYGTWIGLEDVEPEDLFHCGIGHTKESERESLPKGRTPEDLGTEEYNAEHK